MPELLLIHPSLPRAPIPLVAPKTTVGRHPTCHILLVAHSVSRFHAELCPSESSIEVVDLNSRNGTYVDGVRIASPTVVQLGQHISFGTVTLKLTPGVEKEDDNEELETRSVSAVWDCRQPMIEKLLSKAELRVFELLLKGNSDKDMASKLEISRHTVHNHVRKIFAATKVRSRAELLAKFVDPKR